MSIQIPLWAILAIFAAVTTFRSAQDWLGNHFEFYRFGVTRCWYGSAAHVCLRSAAEDDDPDRFAVLARWDENTAVPWLLVHRLDREHLTYWDEDAEAFWAPVTDFAPYTVRQVRPHVERFGRVYIPWLTRYLPLRQPRGYLQDGTAVPVVTDLSERQPFAYDNGLMVAGGNEESP